MLDFTNVDMFTCICGFMRWAGDGSNLTLLQSPFALPIINKEPLAWQSRRASLANLINIFPTPAGSISVKGGGDFTPP